MSQMQQYVILFSAAKRHETIDNCQLVVGLLSDFHKTWMEMGFGPIRFWC